MMQKVYPGVQRWLMYYIVAIIVSVWVVWSTVTDILCVPFRVDKLSGWCSMVELGSLHPSELLHPKYAVAGHPIALNLTSKCWITKEQHLSLFRQVVEDPVVNWRGFKFLKVTERKGTWPAPSTTQFALPTAWPVPGSWPACSVRALRIARSCLFLTTNRGRMWRHVELVPAGQRRGNCWVQWTLSCDVCK